MLWEIHASIKDNPSSQARTLPLNEQARGRCHAKLGYPDAEVWICLPHIQHKSREGLPLLTSEQAFLQTAK